MKDRGRSNPAITHEFIEKYIDKPWDWSGRGLSSNPSITEAFVEKHIGKPWYWGEGSPSLSSNPSITSSFIKKHTSFSSQSSITFFEKQIDRLEMSSLSSNPSITMEFIEKHIDKPWHWGHYGLSKNQFENSTFMKRKKEIEKQEKIRRGLAKLNDLVFFKYTGNPYHPIGRRRLEKQYDELMKLAPNNYNLK